MHKILFAYKPAGITSFEFTRKVQIQYESVNKKKIKIGHTGTLDKFAEGLMILLFDEATAFFNEFVKLDKQYIAEIQIGKQTTTLDSDGEIIIEWEQNQIQDFIESYKLDLQKTLLNFIYQKKQTPPKYSAIKIKGKRSSDLIRKGLVPELKERSIKIYRVEILSISEEGKILVKFYVSSGTYIRAIVRDLGIQLNIPAFLSSLKRISIGKWKLDDIKLYDLNSKEFFFYDVLDILTWDKIDIEEIAHQLKKGIEEVKKFFFHGKVFEFNTNSIQTEEFFIVENQKKIIAWLKKDFQKYFKYKKVFTS